MPIVNLTYNIGRAITKSDTVEVEQINGHYPTAIWVGGAGIVNAIMQDNQTVAYTCVAGTVLPISCKQVTSATTTATLLVGLYQG